MITGASLGLGLAIARELGRLGAHVTIAARDEAELGAARQDHPARGIGVSVMISDLTDPTQASRLVGRVIAEGGRLDILVDNAGVIQVGPLEHMEIADFEEALIVHFWAPPAKLAVVANAIAPSAIALGMRITERSAAGPGNEAHSGWQSFSAWAPSKLTRLTERAAIEHNQLTRILGRP